MSGNALSARTAPAHLMNYRFITNVPPWRTARQAEGTLALSRSNGAGDKGRSRVRGLRVRCRWASRLRTPHGGRLQRSLSQRTGGTRTAMRSAADRLVAIADTRGPHGRHRQMR